MVIQGRFWVGLVAFAAIAINSGMTAEVASLGPSCLDARVGDAVCDHSNNKAACAYDGGDCCECTCVDTTSNACGDEGFACIDPEAPCVEDDDVTSVCIDLYSGDGYCDSINNAAECQYDGDTDQESALKRQQVLSAFCNTCVDAEYLCDDFGGSACIDPDAPCVDDDDYTSAYNSLSSINPTTGCIDSYIGDGFCDLPNNLADCQFDGGDCCTCTCVDAGFLCDDYGGFACVDPDAPCVDDDDYSSAYYSSSWWSVNATTGCIDSYVSDGFCDATNNYAECQFDGGDCCRCTCAKGSHNCGTSGYNCQDPKAPCVGEDDSNCVLTSSGDGMCDEINNDEKCDYDGGDCCESSCKHAQFICGSNGYNCLDPEGFSSAEQHLPACVLTVFIGAIGVLIHALG
ncbi:unnamed protein product [Ascophyllum nodosum]